MEDSIKTINDLIEATARAYFPNQIELHRSLTTKKEKIKFSIVKELTIKNTTKKLKYLIPKIQNLFFNAALDLRKDKFQIILNNINHYKIFNLLQPSFETYIKSLFNDRLSSDNEANMILQHFIIKYAYIIRKELAIYFFLNYCVNDKFNYSKKINSKLNKILEFILNKNY